MNEESVLSAWLERIGSPARAESVRVAFEDARREGPQAAPKRLQAKGQFLLYEYTMSEKFLLESLELNPNNSEAYYLLGRTYHIQNESEKALQAYYKSLLLLYGEPPTH